MDPETARRQAEALPAQASDPDQPLTPYRSGFKPEARRGQRLWDPPCDPPCAAGRCALRTVSAARR